MAIEIERKFLLDTNKLPALAAGVLIKQAYIETIDNTVVRIRLMGEQAYLTIKGENQGASRPEFEYAIPLQDANEMIEKLCHGPIIEKTRYTLKHAQHLWEIDIFAGDNQGLQLAEVELQAADEVVELPDWVATEVTHDKRYYNSNLLKTPYKNWDHV